MVTVNPVFLGAWVPALRPARGWLVRPLGDIFRDKGRPETERTLATNVLRDYARDEPEQLANLVMDADEKAYRILLPVAAQQGEKMVKLFGGRTCGS